jgi:hypothetical protein
MSRNLKLLITLLIVGTVAAYVAFVTIPTQLARRSYDAAKALGDDFRRAFQFTPEVKVNNTIVLNQQTPVLELAVLSQRFEHRYVWENSWMGSTKKIFITGTFDARVGFDLNRKFSITLRDDKAFVAVPAPETLSVESQSDMTYRDEQGVWNWVSVQDRTRATNAFISDARKYAEKAAFVQDAKRRLEERLKTVLKPYADEVVVDYTDTIIPQ